MAIVVADGTGLNNADSYVTLAYMIEFARSILDYDLSTLTETQQEDIAKSGTDHLDGYSFKGQKLLSTQALKFPRTGISETGIPIEVMKATVCFAVHRQVHGLINTHSGSTTDLSDNSKRLITKTVRQVGPIRTEDEYSNVNNVYSISKNSSSNSVIDPSEESYISKGERYLKEFLLVGNRTLTRSQ